MHKLNIRSKFVEDIIDSHPSTAVYRNEHQAGQEMVEQSLTSNESIETSDPFVSMVTADILSMTSESRPSTSMEPLRAEFNTFFGTKPFDHKVDSLLWWKEHESEMPLLAKIARDVFCVPATSATSERIFSASGNIISDRLLFNTKFIRKLNRDSCCMYNNTFI